MNTKIRLLQLGKTQIDLLEVLRKKGYSTLCPQTVSAMINHRLDTPLAYQVREEIGKILTEWEKEREEELNNAERKRELQR